MRDEQKLKKLSLLRKEPNLAFLDEYEAINGKLESLQAILSEINVKEVVTYQNELRTLQEALQSLTESVINKDTVVNIPLDQLSKQLVKVEQAIKNIKEVKIPEVKFPTEYPLSEIQINEILLAIQSIPEFPIDSLQSMVNELGKKIEAIKLEVPENKEFDYEFLEDNFIELIEAVKNISISVSSGGGIGERANENLDAIKANTTGLATSAKQLPDNHNVTVSNPTADPETGLAKEAKQDTAISNQERIIGQNPQADSQSVTFATDHYDEMSRLLATIDAEHSAIHKGWHFNYADYETNIDNGTTIDFTFTTPDTAEWTHFIFKAYSSLGITVELYEGATGVSGGTAITPRNNNRNSVNTSGVILLKDPTITDDGTRAAGFLAGADRTAGSAGRENEFILKQNTTYITRITSLANSNSITWDAEWYEYESFTNN